MTPSRTIVCILLSSGVVRLIAMFLVWIWWGHDYNVRCGRHWGGSNQSSTDIYCSCSCRWGWAGLCNFAAATGLSREHSVLWLTELIVLVLELQSGLWRQHTLYLCGLGPDQILDVAWSVTAAQVWGLSRCEHYLVIKLMKLHLLSHHVIAFFITLLGVNLARLILVFGEEPRGWRHFYELMDRSWTTLLHWLELVSDLIECFHVVLRARAQSSTIVWIGLPLQNQLLLQLKSSPLRRIWSLRWLLCLIKWINRPSIVAIISRAKLFTRTWKRPYLLIIILRLLLMIPIF